jgi:hypothetical protein
MTEAQWWKSKNGDEMLELVSERLSPRKWALLGCGVVRRIIDLLPIDPFRRIVDRVEREEEISDSVREQIEAATPAAVEAARAKQHTLLIGCDPDAAGQQFQDTVGRRTNPAVPLFETASVYAANTVQLTGAAVEAAAQAVGQLLPVRNAEGLARVREHVVEAQVRMAQSGIWSSLALELKTRGDEMADRGPARNARIRLSEANDTADRLGEQAMYKVSRLEGQKTRADRLALAKLLREQLGNPFQPYRFEAKWCTETVAALARAIDGERAFDRMPILADALLEADCDEEAMLRHCRGSELHTKEPPHHAHGCWVLDLILKRDEEVFTAPPLNSRKRPQGRRSMQLGPFRPPPQGIA